MAGPEASVSPVVVVVDVANVMGSRPDGWWRDRAGAATTLLARMPQLVGRTVDVDGETVVIDRVVAVVEGRATDAVAPAGIDVIAAPADGDTTVVEVAAAAAAAGERVLVVTADRGLRARLPDSVAAVGPGWINDLISR